MAADVRGMPTLDVYITRHCFGCAEARRLADAVAARFTAVSVRVVDLDRDPDSRPDNLVAVPTYMLDGRVVSLGNPRQADLFRRIERLLETSQIWEGGDGSP